MIWITDFKSPIDKTTEYIYDIKKISERSIQEISKTREQIDICIKITNLPSVLCTIDLLVNTITEIKRNRKIKTRCIIDNTKENIIYFKKLKSMADEIRYSDMIESIFFLNEVTYASIHVEQRKEPYQRLLPQLIVNS